MAERSITLYKANESVRLRLSAVLPASRLKAYCCGAYEEPYRESMRRATIVEQKAFQTIECDRRTFRGVRRVCHASPPALRISRKSDGPGRGRASFFLAER